MGLRNITIIILLAVATILICWDGFVISKNNGSATISEILYKTATIYPILAFALGVLAGHLFWPQFRQ